DQPSTDNRRASGRCARAIIGAIASDETRECGTRGVASATLATIAHVARHEPPRPDPPLARWPLRQPDADTHRGDPAEQCHASLAIAIRAGDRPMTSGLAARLAESSRGSGRRWWVLAAVECGNFVVYMDAFIVTLALPAMARQFGVGIHEIKWVLIAYLTALTVSLMLAGRLADRWG